MTDFDFDVREKKRIARGAFNKKKGNKSKRCSLPSDYMTNKEWLQRNGEIIVYNMNKPMDFDTFKTLAPSSQNAYLNWIKKRHGANFKAVCQMFGVSKYILQKYMRENGITVEFPHGVPPYAKAENRKKWLKFIGTEAVEPTPALVTPVSEVAALAENTEDYTSPVAESSVPVVETAVLDDEPTPTPTESIPVEGTEHAQNECNNVNAPVHKMTVGNFKVAFDGVIDPTGIAHMLLNILGENSRGTLYISYEREEEE